MKCGNDIKFMWHEIKASVAGQIGKHGITTINSKYENDNKIHEVIKSIIKLLLRLV